MITVGWEEQAREQGALRRNREIKTPEDLPRLIFPYLTEGKSFAGTGEPIGLDGETSLNKPAVYKRIGASGNRVNTGPAEAQVRDAADLFPVNPAQEFSQRRAECADKMRLEAQSFHGHKRRGLKGNAVNHDFLFLVCHSSAPMN
jgi:hypothetical protein